MPLRSITESIGPPLMPPKSYRSGGRPNPIASIQWPLSNTVQISLRPTTSATPPPGMAANEMSEGESHSVPVAAKPEK